MTSAALIRRRRSSASLLSLYSALGIRPELAFDFANERYFTSRVPTTFSDAITHTRASTATYVDSSGALQTAASGEPRVGHHVWDGSAWVNEGLLHESEARTNLLLNSATLSTQSVTVTAVAHTLHFTGTGTITLSGASTDGPLVGTGTGENNRVSLTFTPTAGSLTLTVSGTVTNAQLEVGPTPSSYIPTSGSTVTRAADVLTIPSANLPWPSPVVIGSELVTNGTFDTDISGWSSDNGIASWNAAGYLDFDRNSEAFGNHIYQNISTTLGKVYEISYNLLAVSNQVDLRISNVTAQGDTTTGTKSYVFVATGATTEIEFDAAASATATFSIDNVSVREINPLAVSIQMDGAINYSDEGIAAQQTLLRWQLDANNYISVDLDTDSTATGEVNFNQAASGTVDTVATAGTALSPSIATAFNIASRHGSTFINGALNGTALTEDTTPVALADLSAKDLNLGFDYNGTIRTFRVWANDIGDTGIEEAST